MEFMNEKSHRGSGLFVTKGARVPDGTLQRAREHRREPTQAEYILWEALRGRRAGGLKFRRQQPIGAFIADFYCDALALVIEVDGMIHESQKAYDAERTTYFATRGLRVHRVSNEAVLTNIQAVIEQILAIQKI